MDEVAAPSKNVYECGGSLIHPQIVLTGVESLKLLQNLTNLFSFSAAHCVQTKNISSMKVRVGEWDTQTANEIFPHTDYDVRDFVVHPNFYNRGLFNDIALVFLKTQVYFEPHINMICLPPQGSVFDGSSCFASGWGKDVFGREGTGYFNLKTPTIM